MDVVTPTDSAAAGFGIATPPATPAGVLPEPALGVRVVRGVVWVLAQNVLVKAMGIASQVVLARLLLKDDFALVGLAGVVASFAGIVQDAGLSQILIQRQRRFALWAGTVAWMSLASGLLAGAIIAAAAPLAAHVYEAPRLLPLLMLLALGAPISTITIVPAAAFQVQLRFKFLATWNAITGAAVLCLTMVMAWAGYGPYSIVVPPIVVNVVRFPILWWLSGVRVPLAAPRVGRWRFVLRDSLLIIASAFCITVTVQSDNLVLGLFATKASLADYLFAFGLAFQVMMILTGSVSSVLLPTLSRIGREPGRQAEAFLRAARLLAFIGAPICLLQAAVAPPLFYVAFGGKWASAVVLFQILSVANALQLTNGAAVSFLQAQRRFGTIFKVTVSLAVLFVTFVTAGAAAGGAMGVACAVVVYAGLSGIFVAATAIRPFGGHWLRDAAAVSAGPLVAAAGAAIVACAFAALVPGSLSPLAGHLLRLAIIPPVGFVTYLALAAWLARPAFDEARARVAPFLARLRRR